MPFPSPGGDNPGRMSALWLRAEFKTLVKGALILTKVIGRNDAVWWYELQRLQSLNAFPFWMARRPQKINSSYITHLASINSIGWEKDHSGPIFSSFTLELDPFLACSLPIPIPAGWINPVFEICKFRYQNLRSWEDTVSALPSS